MQAEEESTALAGCVHAPAAGQLRCLTSTIAIAAQPLRTCKHGVHLGAQLGALRQVQQQLRKAVGRMQIKVRCSCAAVQPQQLLQQQHC